MPNGIQFFYMFPSPLGDEVLKPGYIKDGKRGDQPMFPSPLGDEVLKPFAKFCPSLFDNNKISFRPLSGMRCLNHAIAYADSSSTEYEFPSPLGDEVLKPQNITHFDKTISQHMFPSPLGDEVLKP